MRTSLLATSAAVALMAAGAAQAATTTAVGTSTGQISGDGLVTVTLDQFDTSLGTLNSVSFSIFAGTSAATVTVTNTGSSTETSEISLVSEITITDNDGVLSAILPSSGEITVSDDSGPIMLNGGDTSSPINLSASASNGTNIGVTPAGNSAFEGTGTFSFDFAFDTGFLTETGSNFQVTGGSLSDAEVSVVYDYTAAVPDVPVPAALPLFASALGVFGIARYRRKS